jgi:hypothetical protein
LHDGVTVLQRCTCNELRNVWFFQSSVGTPIFLSDARIAAVQYMVQRYIRLPIVPSV